MTGEGELLTVPGLAAMIDHAVLNPQCTRAELDLQLALAAELSVFSVFVPTRDTEHAVRFLRGSGVLVGAPIGFPHGSGSTASKLAEVRQALDDGAAEIDVVQQIGWLRGGRDEAVEDELRRVVEASEGRIVKVILETAYLTEEEIARACGLAERAGAHFVKTSTGFARTGATLDALRIMRSSVGPRMSVKASSGVRSLDAALAMMRVGVTRFGMSSTREILAELGARLTRGERIELPIEPGVAPGNGALPPVTAPYGA
ncbi:MAG: deoxyribose-phosphate aldolase [Naasia sp.]|jgi:deoxyribose-phosphate aldolase|uniref:deoxyribose-phosphate aldolase n=1 Tax=Naasia sp. TaxID=2546198 RepID=UPI00262A0E20|nr:deoxyribose-phosphate aldolase [Naasia sp.]MCU1570942.1 deoxyribose-phosphate aldolase [Naasia sp.]